MGSTNYLGKPRAKNGSVVGSDKDVAAKLRRSKIRRPGKLNDYGLKRIPDYTELAYKEAVSKLRYFLSGNYAPSFRSYGGSASIKNLDESDADTDKKYPAYLSTLDYKPKPRLTAKYATLYADSLKNAYTPTANVNVPSGGAPVGGPCDTTNPDVVQFIQKQEEYIEQLERESQYCRDELNNLLGKVKEVISENEHLHDAQKNRIISRMLHSGGSETDDLDDTNGFESDKTSPMKSRKPKKSSSSSKLDGPNIVFESRISELEAQLTQARIDLKKVQDENNENKRKLASGLVDSSCLDGFKRQIDNLQRDKTMLESQVSKLKQSLDQREDAEAGARHARSDTERKLREDKNGLELEIQRLKEELDAERGRVRELCGEGARRALRERSAAEQRYNAHFDELQHDLAAQYDNVAKLQLDLERQRREENDLKRELSMKTAAIEELRMELKNKTASLQADLAQAHAEKASLEEELANARLALERQQRQAKHETNRQNSEIQSLRQRLDRADADLVHARRENLRLSEQISTLEKELNMKNLSPISPEKNKKEKELSTMIESMENKHAQTVAELESMIHSQNSLMEKLTGECRLLTDKLDDANRRHKAQSRSRTDEPIRTQRDDASHATTGRVRHRNLRESGSSNKQPPVVVGPLTTSQDLDDTRGETVYNLPLMIQQPFLQEKKEPIKVDISVKLIPRSRRKDRKKSNASYIEADEESGVKNSFSMDITNGNVSLTKKSVEIIAPSVPQNGNKLLEDFKLNLEDKIKIDVDEKAKHEHIITEESKNKDEISNDREIVNECSLHNEGDVLENTECINTDQKLEDEVVPEDIQSNLTCRDPLTVGTVEDPDVESIDKIDVDPVVESAERAQLLYRNTELMRKLRNLWCSHKKYCTTATHSLRSRTPISGYPNSSFSEFDRTAFTSTPIRYGRSRTLGDVQTNDVRYLTRYLSDLSIDRLVDSDEDSQKACFVFREELATLQRQVESLGRSLQSPSITAPPTSSYQAPSSHAAASLRTNEHTPANTGRDYTRDDPTRNTEVSGKSPNSDIREDRIDGDDGQRLESVSNALIDNQSSNNDQIGVSKDSEQIGFDVSAHENGAFVDESAKNYDDGVNEQVSHSGVPLENQHIEKSDTHNVQNENQEEYNQNYENNEPNYQEMENQQYDQGNYDQNYENSDPQYQDQQYQQQYDPNQEYTQEQYDGQYDQYPDQNYAQPQYDTSAQNYEGQYENYNNDGSYQQQQSQEYPQETSQYVDDQKDLDHTEKQRSNSPSAKVPYES